MQKRESEFNSLFLVVSVIQEWASNRFYIGDDYSLDRNKMKGLFQNLSLCVSFAV